jgi:uncharacterized protein
MAKMAKKIWIMNGLLLGVLMAGCSTIVTPTPTPSPAISPSDRPGVSDRSGVSAEMLLQSEDVTVTETLQEGRGDHIIASKASKPIMRQSLPITAQMQVGNQVIRLEVAKTPEQQAIGLMNRTELARDRGMVFPFSPARPVSFWMKNTLIPLDMIFVHKGKVVAVIDNVPPCKADPCPSYGVSQALVDQVIELRAGRAAELGIKPGDPLRVNPL